MTSPEAISKQTLRIIDVNLNRIGEGLRLLEDAARLLLNDTSLTQQLKDMRHKMVVSDFSFQQQLLQSRNAEGDVGINIEVSEEEKQKDLPLVIVANARRVQESLRALEEMAKIPNAIPELDPKKFKQARFHLYTLERSLLSRLTRQDKLKRLSGLYFILDTQALKERDYMEVARNAIRGGARTIQLRDKLHTRKDLLPIAQQLRSLCTEHNVLFIMNDYVDVTLATDADGLHLGQEDLPLATARRLLPIDKILGYSTHTLDQAITAASEGADYIGFGSIYPTTSKDFPTIVGLEKLREIRKKVSLPIVAIGGINSENATEVMAAGADSIAVISAILQAEDIEEATRQIVAKLEI